MFGHFDSNFEQVCSYLYLEFANELLGKSTLSDFFTTDIKARKYFCFDCKVNIEKYDDESEIKWAFLKPNEPTSKLVHCINCNCDFIVERKKCTNPSCLGNVIEVENNICLSCLKEYIE